MQLRVGGWADAWRGGVAGASLVFQPAKIDEPLAGLFGPGTVGGQLEKGLPVLAGFLAAPQLVERLRHLEAAGIEEAIIWPFPKDGQTTALVHRDENGDVTISASRPPGVKGVTGDGTVCTLTFQAKAASDSTVQVIKSAARNSAQTILPILAGSPATVHVQ